MASFEMKEWLDQHVVPLKNKSPLSRIHSFIWNGSPPKEILVWLLCGDQHFVPTSRACGKSTELAERAIKQPEQPEKPAFKPHDWPDLLRRLLDKDEFRFDYLREQQMVAIGDGLVPVFGGDGAPLFSKDGMASARLFRKMEDGICLILQLGCKYPKTDELTPGMHASSAVKAFFKLFGDENPLTVCSKYGAVFGQA